MGEALFDSWSALGRTAVIGVLAYAGLILILRVSGRRTLSKMNAFDFVVTVALGSTLATILLNRDVALADGVLALGLLVGLQYVITWSSVRMAWVRRVVTGEPLLLLYGGRVLPTNLRRARVTEAEVWAAVRGAGLGAMEEVEAVVLETDGSMSVVRSGGRSGSSLADIDTPQ